MAIIIFKEILNKAKNNKCSVSSPVMFWNGKGKLKLIKWAVWHWEHEQICTDGDIREQAPTGMFAGLMESHWKQSRKPRSLARMHLKEKILNLSWVAEKESSPSSYLHRKIRLWYVDHSENKRNPDEGDKHGFGQTRQQGGSRLPWGFIGSTNVCFG